MGEVVLTAMPTTRTDERALLDVVKTLRRFDWDRFLVGLCCTFHVAVASWLALAPYDQVLTSGTRPALEMQPRGTWAFIFLLLGAAIAGQCRVRWPWLRAVVWFAMLGVGGLWLTAFGLAVTDGEGSAAFIGWLFLYTVWFVLAFRVGLRER